MGSVALPAGASLVEEPRSRQALVEILALPALPESMVHRQLLTLSAVIRDQVGRPVPYT